MNASSLAHRRAAAVDQGRVASAAWNIPLDHCITLEPSEIYLLAPIASQLPYTGRFRTFAGFVQRLLDVMWRTIGNMGYLYAVMDDQRFHGVPVTVIEPTQ